ncbi:MAG: hypothetical protein ABMA01_10140 [Chthoniobacteraceae bacterium]
MKTFTSLLLTAVLLFASPAFSPAKLPPKSTEFAGTVESINESSVTVKGPKGTRSFAIYSGTVFGQRAKATFADFKPGENMLVIFSDEGGKAKAENIRNPADDKKKPAKKKGAAKGKK